MINFLVSKKQRDIGEKNKKDIKNFKKIRLSKSLEKIASLRQVFIIIEFKDKKN